MLRLDRCCKLPGKESFWCRLIFHLLLTLAAHACNTVWMLERLGLPPNIGQMLSIFGRSSPGILSLKAVFCRLLKRSNFPSLKEILGPCMAL